MVMVLAAIIWGIEIHLTSHGELSLDLRSRPLAVCNINYAAHRQIFSSLYKSCFVKLDLIGSFSLYTAMSHILPLRANLYCFFYINTTGMSICFLFLDDNLARYLSIANRCTNLGIAHHQLFSSHHVSPHKWGTRIYPQAVQHLTAFHQGWEILCILLFLLICHGVILLVSRNILFSAN